MNEQTFQIIELVVKLIVAIIVAFVIPAIKSYLDGTTLERICKQAVSTAAQLFEPTPEYNAIKKQYAVSMVLELAKKFRVSLTEEQASDLIEAAYNVYKKEV